MYGKHRYGQVRYAEGLFGTVVICGALALIGDRSFIQLIIGDRTLIQSVIGDRTSIQLVMGDRAFTHIVSGEPLTFTITSQDRLLDSC